MAKKSRQRDEMVVAAPGPLTVGDRTFLVRSPSKADLVTVRNWVRQNYRRILGVTAGLGVSSADLDGLSPQDRAVVLREATRLAKGEARRSLSDEEAMDVMTSPEGAAFMVWVAARRDDPAVTLDWLKSVITEENVAQVLADFDDATGVKDDGDDEGDEPDPKAPGSASR